MMIAPQLGQAVDPPSLGAKPADTGSLRMNMLARRSRRYGWANAADVPYTMKPYSSL